MVAIPLLSPLPSSLPSLDVLLPEKPFSQNPSSPDPPETLQKKLSSYPSPQNPTPCSCLSLEPPDYAQDPLFLSSPASHTTHSIVHCSMKMSSSTTTMAGHAFCHTSMQLFFSFFFRKRSPLLQRKWKKIPFPWLFAKGVYKIITWRKTNKWEELKIYCF